MFSRCMTGKRGGGRAAWAAMRATGCCGVAVEVQHGLIVLPAAGTTAGAHTEAIRGLETIRTKKETELASVCALLHFHMAAGGTDVEAIAGLQRDLEVAKE